MLSGLLAASMGCKSYEPKPLDLEAHAREALARHPGDEAVRHRATETGPPGTFDLQDGLHLGEAEAVALVFNADLRLGRMQAGVARAAADNAGLWPDPVLGYNAEFILNDVAEPWVSVGRLELTLPISGRLGAEAAAASAEARAVWLRLEADEWRVRSRLKAAWHRWSAAERGRLLLEAQEERLQRLAAPFQRLADQGEIPAFELRAFRRARATLNADRRAAEAEVATLRLAVLQVLGLQPGAPVELVPSLDPVQVDAPADPAELRRRSPDLAALAAAYEVAEEQLRLEICKQWPDLTLFPGVGNDEATRRVYLGFTLPLPLWNRNQQGVAVAEARREASRVAVEAASEQLTARHEAAGRRLEAARDIRRGLEAEMAPLLVEQREELEQLTAAGRLGPYAFVEIHHGTLAAEQRLLAARLQECLAASELWELIGFEPRADRVDRPEGRD